MPATLPRLASRGRRSDFQRTRRRIVEAARALMAERGPESLTVSAVAHAAGINRTTAYQHFRTRDELVRALSSELIQEVTALISEQRPIAERIDHVAGHFVEHPEIARLVLYLLLSENPLPREYWTAFFAEMDRLSETGALRPDIDREMLAHVLMSVAILWPLHARASFEDEADKRAATARLSRELKRLLLYGLFPPEDWPDLVASVDRTNPPTRLRPRKGTRS
jgi:AcrR family transcriptional regulator